MSKQKRDGPPFQCAATVVPLCIDQSHCAVILKAGFCEERVISESNYHRERDRNLSLFESLFEISLSIEISLHWDLSSLRIQGWVSCAKVEILVLIHFSKHQFIHFCPSNQSLQRPLSLSVFSCSFSCVLSARFLSFFFVAPRALLQSWWDDMHR